MTVSKDLKKAVEKGAKWLDKKHSGWAKHINLKTLDMFESDRCVIGQVLGDFNELIKPLGWTNRHGFSVTFSSSYETEMANYAILDKLWTKEVKKRLN